MMSQHLRIGLASPRAAASRAEGLVAVERFLTEAAARGVAIVCFPETYLPGYRGLGFEPPPADQAAQDRALSAASDLAKKHQVAVILPMEWAIPIGLLNTAFVIDADGTV